MPVTVEVDRTRKLVLTFYSGEVTDTDVKQQIADIHRAAPYDPDYRVITDFTQVTQFEISAEQIKEVASTESPLSKATRIMVAPSDIAYGTSRMFQALAWHTRPNITVVRTLVEAYEVLGVEST
jgi:hypothetical protein